MRSRLSITIRNARILGLLSLVFLPAVNAFGQRLAILTPDGAESSQLCAVAIASRLVIANIRIVDGDEANTAFRSKTILNPFNMTTTEAKTIASVMGVDHFLLVRAAVQRRTSISRSDYYEGYAAHFLVDGRSGELTLWRLKSFEGETPAKAEQSLIASSEATAAEIVNTVKTSSGARRFPASNVEIESVPEEGSPAATGLKPPIPYKRIKPEYTSTAFLYDVKATVDIEVDIGVDGSILGSRVVRWAGFGLDESVETAVRSMNWRPAMRAGGPLPMRVLLRYNFTKTSKE